MLRLFLDHGLNSDFGQSLIIKDNTKIGKLSKNIDRLRVAYSPRHILQLVFYARDNPRGRHEAGIIYEPSPMYKSGRIFSKEMLRFFHVDEYFCIALCEKYYIHLVKERRFTR